MVYVQKNYHIKNDKVMKKNNLSLYELLIKNYGISTSTIRKLETRYLVNFRSLLINFRLKAENRHKILKKINFLILNTFNLKNKLNETLRNQIKLNITILNTIKSYKGFRHRLRLPVRGQRTHTNAKTSLQRYPPFFVRTSDMKPNKKKKSKLLIYKSKARLRRPKKRK